MSDLHRITTIHTHTLWLCMAVWDHTQNNFHPLFKSGVTTGSAFVLNHPWSRNSISCMHFSVSYIIRSGVL